MDTYEAIVTRRSTRSYRPGPVEPEKLRKIIEAGRHAPSGGNSQTSHFLVVQKPEALARLIDLAEKGLARMEVREDTYASLKRCILRARQGGYVFTYHAPVLVVMANKRGYGNAMADCVAAIENMMIEANELDLGTCYINQLNWLGDDPALVEYLRSLGLAEDERVFASLAIGHADSESGLPSRTPLERRGNRVTWIG